MQNTMVKIVYVEHLRKLHSKHFSRFFFNHMQGIQKTLQLGGKNVGASRSSCLGIHSLRDIDVMAVMLLCIITLIAPGTWQGETTMFPVVFVRRTSSKPCCCWIVKNKLEYLDSCPRGVVSNIAACEFEQAYLKYRPRIFSLIISVGDQSKQLLRNQANNRISDHFSGWNPPVNKR